MVMYGFDNKENNRHFEIPTKFLRYLSVESANTEQARFFVKALGFKNRIELNKETYEATLAVMEE